MAGSRQRRWEEVENAMKERKKNTSWQNETEKLKRRDQVAVTRLRTGYSRATHRNKMKGTPKLILKHILWQCIETDEERQKSNITKEVRKEREEGAKMLVEYVKNIGLY
jgi:hypothetical protein